MIPAQMIEYLSPPAQVSMADRWFEIASIEHFWIKRRFDVLRRLAGELVCNAHEIAEFGCGHGLLQRQIENVYGRAVTGFDLNEFALQKNLSQFSKVCCYDIYQKDQALRGRFDLLLLFDVLEHIAEEGRFLSALLYHLAPAGKLIVNVPAGQWAYSAYDEAAGHVRRYSIRSLRDSTRRNGLKIVNWTYWGFPLLPPLILRKVWVLGSHGDDEIIVTGFDSRSNMINRLLGFLSKCERIPQALGGSSLMAIFEIDGSSY